MRRFKSFFAVFFVIIIVRLYSQPLPPSLTFELKTASDVKFSFTTIQDYLSGIIKFNVITLNIKAIGTEWDLYVKTTTNVAGYWDEAGIYYSTSGEKPPVNILELRFNNINKTANDDNFFPVTNIPVYVIGSSNNDPSISCGLNQPTNVPGNYLDNPSCYKFNVDMKIKPGMNLPNVYRAGIYTLRVDFILVEDL